MIGHSRKINIRTLLISGMATDNVGGFIPTNTRIFYFWEKPNEAIVSQEGIGDHFASDVVVVGREN